MPERPGAEYCASFGPGRAPHPVVRTPPTPHTLNVEKHMASGTLDTPAGTAPTPLAGPNGNGRAAIPARTLRTDNWRKAPILTVVLLTAWILYAVVRAFMQRWYWVEDYHYLTPFYSPCVSNGCEGDSSLFGRFLPDIPIFPFALLTLPFLGLFRLTCYYYRRAYYRSYWGSPPACAVPDLHKSYQGESRMPLILQNSHRYFFYAAVLLSIVNTDRRDPRVPFAGRIRDRARHDHPGDQRDPALGVHGVLPLLPAHRRRPAAALLQAPGPLPRLGFRVQAQHEAHAAGLDHSRHPGGDGLLRHGRGRRLDLRPADRRLGGSR
jgi:hypothetical protein